MYNQLRMKQALKKRAAEGSSVSSEDQESIFSQSSMGSCSSVDTWSVSTKSPSIAPSLALSHSNLSNTKIGRSTRLYKPTVRSTEPDVLSKYIQADTSDRLCKTSFDELSAHSIIDQSDATSTVSASTASSYSAPAQAALSSDLVRASSNSLIQSIAFNVDDVIQQAIRLSSATSDCHSTTLCKPQDSLDLPVVLCDSSNYERTEAKARSYPTFEEPALCSRFDPEPVHSVSPAATASNLKTVAPRLKKFLNRKK